MRIIASQFKKSNYTHLWTLFLLFFSSHVYGQSDYALKLIDSVDQVNGITKVKLFNEISWQLREEKLFRAASSYARVAIDSAKRFSFKEELATAFSRAGDVESDDKRTRLAINYYDSSLSTSEKHGFAYGIGRAANQLSIAHEFLGQHALAKSIGKKAVRTFKDMGLKDLQGVSLNTLGKAFLSAAEYDSSLIFLNNSLDLRVETNNKEGVAESYMNLGGLYERMENYDRSLTYSQQALDLYDSLRISAKSAMVLSNIGNVHYKLSNLDKAEENYLESLDIKRELSLLNEAAPEYNNLGNIYTSRRNWSKAEEFFQLSLDLKRKQNDPQAFTSEINLGNLERKRGRPELALNYYLSVYLELDSLNLLNGYPEVISSISDLYAELGNPGKAIEFAQIHRAVKDQIQAELIRVGNLELEIQETRNTLALLQKENEKQAIEQARQHDMLKVQYAAISTLAFIFFLAYRNIRLKNKNLVVERNNAKKNEEIDRIIKEQEIQMFQARMAGQEKERSRVAQDLHDRLGGMLSVAKLHYKSVEPGLQGLNEKNLKLYEQANNMLDEACEEIRIIAQNLSSGALIKFGLIAALEDLRDRIENSSELKIQLYAHGLDGRLDSDFEINVFRIIQELITNTLKHASATKVEVQLMKKADQRLNVMFVDNGIGFDVDKQSRGMGLDNIENRVYQFDGELNIDSGKGAGTTVTLELPLNGKLK